MKHNRSHLIYTGYDKVGLFALPCHSEDKHSGWLANFLMGDLFNSVEYMQHLLSTLRMVENGEEADEVFGGNGMQLTLTRNGAELEHLIFDDQPNEHYTLAEIRAAVEDWLEAIRQHKNSRADG